MPDPTDTTAPPSDPAQIPTNSTPPDMPPEAPEAPRDAVDPSLDKDLNEAPNQPEAPTPNSDIPAPSEPVEAPTAQIQPNEPLAPSFIKSLLQKARLAIQGRKRKKLDMLMTMFAKRTKITNDEVEKLLHVSDATATRYLSILESEGKIRQTGRTGKSVSYVKI